MLLHRLFLHTQLKLNPPLNRLTLLRLLGRFKTSLMMRNHEGCTYNLVLNRGKELLEPTVAKEEDITTVLTGSLVLVPVVVDDVGRQNDVTSSDEEDPLAITAFSHIKASSAFSPSRRLSRDVKTKSGGERPTGLRSRFVVVGRFEEPGTDRPSDARLAYFDVDVEDVVFLEKLLALKDYLEAVDVGERREEDTYPQDDRGEGPPTIPIRTTSTLVNCTPSDSRMSSTRGANLSSQMSLSAWLPTAFSSLRS
jgi:hypothetical protein